jgi:hypothetical protein
MENRQTKHPKIRKAKQVGDTDRVAMRNSEIGIRNENQNNRTADVQNIREQNA